MTTQPEALRLAETVEFGDAYEWSASEVAAELRRLHAEVEALRADAERLDWCIDILFCSRPEFSYLVIDVGCGCCADEKEFAAGTTGRAAIDAARGEK
jgi:hypothetical protein